MGSDRKEANRIRETEGESRKDHYYPHPIPELSEEGFRRRGFFLLKMLLSLKMKIEESEKKKKKGEKIVENERRKLDGRQEIRFPLVTIIIDIILQDGRHHQQHHIPKIRTVGRELHQMQGAMFECQSVQFSICSLQKKINDILLLSLIRNLYIARRSPIPEVYNRVAPRDSNMDHDADVF